MDSEGKAFWDHLEAHPEDSTCRLVFADWLQERGDRRAEGIRVLGRLGKWAGRWNSKVPVRGKGFWFWFTERGAITSSCLPHPWWDEYHTRAYKGITGGIDVYGIPLTAIESAAALAWLDLTQEERNGICKLD